MTGETIERLQAKLTESPILRAESLPTSEEIDQASLELAVPFAADYREFLLMLGGAMVGTCYARYAEDGSETFAAQYRTSDGVLEMAWTDKIGELSENFAELQRMVGKQIQRVEGQASDSLRDLILAGKFDPARYAQNHSRGFGGKWKVEIVPKYPNNPDSGHWLILATRLGD